MTSPFSLIGDLGGTNARFALTSGGRPGYRNESTLSCADHSSPLAAIEKYLEDQEISELSSICLAVAAPVASDEIRFINNHWCLSFSELRRRFAPAPVRIINDFKAAAWSVPLLQDDDMLVIGSDAIRLREGEDFSVGLAGPGSGLGISGLAREDGQYHSVSGEGGHQGFSPHTNLQQQVFERVRARFGRVSNERLLSGPGIETIYRAVLEISDQPVQQPTAADIMERAIEGSDDAALTTEMLFYEMLGQVAGDLALLLGAWDGILIGGGIARRYPERLLASGFRQGFENKGRHGELMKDIPTCLITHPNPGLLGASHLLLASQTV